VKPLFTIHAGEFVLGDYIERKYPRVNVWVPTKDTGVDLLVSGKKNKKGLSLSSQILAALPRHSHGCRVSGTVACLRMVGA
jgi:hypothetical protein